MIIDTSALLAIFFDETNSNWVAQKMNNLSSDLMMSTVNLAETLILLQDRQPNLCQEIEEKLFASNIRFIPPDIIQAKIASEARLKFPLNLGDCFVYALAKQSNCAILTLDKDFLQVDCQIIFPQ
jgi:ribonuclease VapC